VWYPGGGRGWPLPGQLPGPSHPEPAAGPPGPLVAHPRPQHPRLRHRPPSRLPSAEVASLPAVQKVPAFKRMSHENYDGSKIEVFN
jgi:hypothetical protein